APELEREKGGKKGLRTSRPCRADADRRLAAGGWPRRHRRYHELHQHIESVRADRRGVACEKSGREWAAHQTLGQDEPRAWLQGGHRISDPGRFDAAARTIGLLPRRL